MVRKLNPPFLFFLIVLSFVSFTASAALAANAVELNVIRNYNDAGNQNTWNNVKQGQLPSNLVKWMTMPSPDEAYRAPYSKSFFQNKYFAICWHTCNDNQPMSVQPNGSNFKVFSVGGADSGAALAMGTIYYWLNELFSRMEQIGFKPDRKLVVNVNRHIPQPESGLDSRNNAFFNDKDWSLNFLDSQNTWFTQKTHQDLLPSYFDPSVAMHEATHSVFQALIGDIINPEIYGLHEAFADYFSLSVLETPHLGQIMFRGRSIREADDTEKYTANMEAHKLGNVVESALWKIRTLFKDKLLADRVALETIKFVSRYPYAMAGDVVPAYGTAYKKIVTGADAGSPSLDEAMKIWNDTGLTPSPSKIDAGPIQKPLDRSNARALKSTTEIPAAIAGAWGIPARTDSSLTLFDLRPAEGTSIWLAMGDSVNDTAPLWILFSLTRQGIQAALPAGSNRPIYREDAEGFKKLKRLSEQLPHFLDLVLTFPSQAAALFDLKDAQKGHLAAFKNGPIIKRGGPQITINGATAQTQSYYRDVKPSFVGNAIGALASITDPQIKGMLKTVTGITLFTVPSSVIKNAGIAEANGESFVGYQLQLNSGARETVFLTDYKGKIEFKPSPPPPPPAPADPAPKN